MIRHPSLNLFPFPKMFLKPKPKPKLFLKPEPKPKQKLFQKPEPKPKRALGEAFRKMMKQRHPSLNLFPFIKQCHGSARELLMRRPFSNLNNQGDASREAC